MLKSMLNDLTRSFMKTDCKTIVCHPSSDGNLRISSVTDDAQLYIYAESIATGWDKKEFAFRDWSSVASIISAFNGTEGFDIKLQCNDEDYPYLMKAKNKHMSMAHYLQNYTFISRQDDLLNSYKGRKFTLKSLDQNYMPNFNATTMSEISKLASLTGEKSFRVKKEGNDLYFCFADETKTIDNGKIKVEENYSFQFTDKGLFFNVDYLNIAFNSLKDQNVMMKFDGGMITVCGSNDVSKKVIAIVGKKDS